MKLSPRYNRERRTDMTTSVEDIIRAIQERPEVREQVRRAILTDELLELPRTVLLQGGKHERHL